MKISNKWECTKNIAVGNSAMTAWSINLFKFELKSERSSVVCYVVQHYCGEKFKGAKVFRISMDALSSQKFPNQVWEVEKYIREGTCSLMVANMGSMLFSAIYHGFEIPHEIKEIYEEYQELNQNEMGEYIIPE